LKAVTIVHARFDRLMAHIITTVPFSVVFNGFLEKVFILRVPSMMMTGGKKEMLSRSVLIFRRKVTWTQTAMFSVNWKRR
jgi:hypothetical protein